CSIDARLRAMCSYSSETSCWARSGGARSTPEHAQLWLAIGVATVRPFRALHDPDRAGEHHPGDEACKPKRRRGGGEEQDVSDGDADAGRPFRLARHRAMLAPVEQKLTEGRMAQQPCLKPWRGAAET